MKFVRKQDEQLIADEYETQLLNVLLSMHFGVPLNQLPKRIKIVRNMPDKDLDTVFEAQNNLQNQKTEEVNSGNVATNPLAMFGAAGESYRVKKIGDEYIVTN